MSIFLRTFFKSLIMVLGSNCFVFFMAFKNTINDQELLDLLSATNFIYLFTLVPLFWFSMYSYEKKTVDSNTEKR